MIVKTTLVGCGAVAQKLYRTSLEKLERQGILSVAGLVDSHRPNAEKMRGFFPRARVYENLEEALKETESELTLVLSPPQFHAEHALTALRHKNHVLCEKPMATTESQCTAMVETARAVGRTLAVGMIRRFFPSFAQFKALLENGGLGEIRSFCYREGRKFDWDVKTPAGFSKEFGAGAGLLFDIGPHALDILTWFFGTPVAISYEDDALGGVEGNLRMDLRTPLGSGMMQLSWDFPLKNELRVVGTKGEAVLRVDQFDKLAVKKEGPDFREVPIDHHFPADTLQPPQSRMCPRLYSQSLYCQLIQTVRAIRLGEPPAVTGQAGKECVAIIESARRLGRPLGMPWLDGNQQEVYQILHWAS